MLKRLLIITFLLCVLAPGVTASGVVYVSVRTLETVLLETSAGRLYILDANPSGYAVGMVPAGLVGEHRVSVPSGSLIKGVSGRWDGAGLWFRSNGVPAGSTLGFEVVTALMPPILPTDTPTPLAQPTATATPTEAAVYYAEVWVWRMNGDARELVGVFPYPACSLEDIEEMVGR